MSIKDDVLNLKSKKVKNKVVKKVAEKEKKKKGCKKASYFFCKRKV